MDAKGKKNLDDSLPLQVVTYFFYMSIPWGFFQENKHFLILDGHGSTSLFKHLNK
jgi:hypothetical protein